MNKNNQPHLLIYDSGVGAFSIFEKIYQTLPNLQTSLLLDNAAFPYGEKAEPALIHRIIQLMGDALARIQPDFVVLACNTASTLALDALRAQFNVEFIGVVPAIKPAAKASISRCIGLLATPATINRAYTKALVEQFANDCELISVGSSRLVYLAEQHAAGESVNLTELQEILQPLLDNNRMDCLVLACTHFPLLAEPIAAILPASVKLIDSGQAIAKRLQALLLGQLSEQNIQQKKLNEIYLTNCSEPNTRQFERISNQYAEFNSPKPLLANNA